MVNNQNSDWLDELATQLQLNATQSRYLGTTVQAHIEQIIGEDEPANREDPSEYTRIARNQLRAEQRERAGLSDPGNKGYGQAT